MEKVCCWLIYDPFIFHQLSDKHILKIYEGNKITACFNESKKKYKVFLVNLFRVFKATIFRGILFIIVAPLQFNCTIIMNEMKKNK